VSASKIFANNLRRERRRLKLTQEQLSEFSDLDRTEVSRLEKGKRDPQLATIEKLAIGLKVPAGQLLDGIPQLS
jgi:transcriptional regulator with XRE-family HTH domain